MENIYTDKETNLTWVMGKNVDTSYTEAELWATAINCRLPTRAELKELFRKNHEFELYSSGHFFWTSESPLGIERCKYKYTLLDNLLTSWSGMECRSKFRWLGIRNGI